MDKEAKTSLSVGAPKFKDCSSFEIITQYFSPSSSCASNDFEKSSDGEKMNLSRLLSPEKFQTLSQENCMALDDLTSPFSASISGDDEQENPPSDGNDEKLVENCIETSKQCIEYLRKQQATLKNLVSTVNDIDINQIHTKDQQINESSGNESLENEVKVKDQSQEDSSYLKILEKNISEMYPRIILAVLIGFIASFILFLSYTVVFESMKMKQIQTYENMTKEERQNSDKYRKETDNFRESLMHKSYEEARQSTDEFKECSKAMDALKTKVSAMEKDLLRVNLEARESENSAKEKIETFRKLVQNLQSNNKNLDEELKAARTSRHTYDYSVLFGLFVGLVFMIFWGSSK